MATRTVRQALSLGSLWLAGAAAACSPAGASAPPLFEDEGGGAPIAPSSPSGPAQPAAPGGGGVLPQNENPPAPGASSDPESCATVRAEVERVQQSVDIIIALDNSGSMDDEARAVEANINVNFASILQESQVDYRVILVSEHRERNLQDTAVCILSPLSTLSACPSDAPGPGERFFQYATEVDSEDSFDVLLETYDGQRADDFGLAPGGWSEWLRPGAKKVFLEISDDDSDTSASAFVGSLTSLAPDQFGADPSQASFVWHSIVGIAQRPVASDPYLAADPVEDRECTGDVANAGTTYQELSRLTGGLRFPICEFAGYDAVFRRIAEDVVQGSGGACEFALPDPPAGRALDLDTVAVSYQPGSGGAPRLLGRATSPALCGPDAFVADGAGVRICPEACEVIVADARASVEVLFTCQSTLLR
jgi:hypothetical protein